MRRVNTTFGVMMMMMMIFRSFACVLAVILGLAILSEPGTFGVKAKHIVGGTKNPSQPRPEAMDRSMRESGVVQYPSPNIATSPEEGYDEAEDGLRQEMMSVLLPYLQGSAEGGGPGSVEGEEEFHENNVIVEGRPTDQTSPFSVSSDEKDELFFSKRFNKRLNMHAPPEEPIAPPQDLEGRNTSSEVLSSQLLRNVTIESIEHLVSTATPHQRGIIDGAPDPARSHFAPLDSSMAVSNPETEGNDGHEVRFPFGSQRFSQEPHQNGNAAPKDTGNSHPKEAGNSPPEVAGNSPPEEAGNSPPEEAGNSPPEDAGNSPPKETGNFPREEPGNAQSEPTKREAVVEEMPPRDHSQYHGMDRISRPEHPMSSDDGNVLASFSPPVFKASDFYSSSTENITGTSVPENLEAVFPAKSNTIDPVLFSHHSAQPDDILGSSEQPPQTFQTGSSQSLSPLLISTEISLEPQNGSEVPWSTNFDPALPTSSSDLQGGMDEHRAQFPVFQSTTSGSAEAAMPKVGDANNLEGTPISNDVGNALGSTTTTLVMEENTDYFSGKPMFRHASSSTRKLTSVASVLCCSLLLQGISRRLA